MAGEDDAGNVQKLRLMSGPTKADLMTSLEALKRLIEDGQVRSIAAIVTFEDGLYDTFWIGLPGTSFYEKVGVLTQWRHDLLRKKHAESHDVEST